MTNGQPKILVVDDDEPILLLMRSVLKEFGFEPLTAKSGSEAVAMARHERPELILLDMSMPDMKGDTVINLIRREAQIEAPVLILSGYRLSGEEIARCGAVGAIQKPFELMQLVSEIRQHLAKAQETAQSRSGVRPV